MTKRPVDEAPALEGLAWDSEHLGFPVARITDADLGPSELGEALAIARTRGVRLVYWPAAAGRVAPDPTLREFAGRLVDRKVTYAIDPVPEPPAHETSGSIVVVEWPRRPPSEPLLRLGVAAGLYSRYRVDPRMPAGAFESLYRTWLARSALGELADALLVAEAPGREGEPLGMVTVALERRSGQIGLIAVDPDARGRGVGSGLVAAAHGWMSARGARRATVVTQQDNLAACRLYEGAGYRVAELRNFYHFWLGEPAGAGPRERMCHLADEPEGRPR